MKVLITGGNRGIGKAAAEKLLNQNCEVIITVRDPQKGRAAISELKEKTGKSAINMVEGDLSDIQSCFTLADRIKDQHQDINCFISNAGVLMTEKQLNKDGLELNFMINYIAPYILCRELVPVLKENEGTRIVNVNSALYTKGKLQLEKTPKGDDFHPIKSYASSKLCNVLFALDLAEELEGTGLTINSVHPGVINTGLGDSKTILSRIIKLIKPFWKKPDYGAIAPVWVATSDELEGVSGKYFNEREEMAYIDYVKDEQLRQQLRNFTEELIKEKTANV
ncbi:SDR family oxidoreductase [Flavilitoribacter nigricans]|uniref:Retinol dehydrogenase n=1 Tax=Flavilitoribacter nigricans (strain ATCC 23147 / DSM 23189 / NBRC 102662 / NCIMB 1420 / SS-2) TaxID=1122177 RepID=A0A2D0N7G2_FLAN2|nr:SDR family oxidoreductase [Flavilitoribacter nigricans]PHN03703.1 retinol dehydrogenase [Flavilitoribacter nigricans DSM 23189 = NBRC 102662]